MTWTEITRCQHDRRALRYASNCTAAEWALIEPLMPGPSKVGRPRKTCMRSVWGEKLENALRKIDGPTIEIVKRPDDAKGFVIVARRWVVERTLAWLNRCRRLAIGRPPSTRLKHGSLLRQLDNWCAASPDRPMSGHDFCVRL